MIYRRTDTVNIGLVELSQLLPMLSTIGQQCTSVRMQFMPYDNRVDTNNNMKRIKVFRNIINDKILSKNTIMYLEIGKFSHYHCTNQITIKFDIGKLCKIIKNYIDQDKDRCVMFIENNNNSQLNLRAINCKIEHIQCSMEKSLANISIIPKLTLYKQLFIPAQKLKEICKILQEISPNLQITNIFDKLYLNAENDKCSTTITYDMSTNCLTDIESKMVSGTNTDSIVISKCLASDVMNFIHLLGNTENTKDFIEIFIKHDSEIIFSCTNSFIKLYMIKKTPTSTN